MVLSNDVQDSAPLPLPLDLDLTVRPLLTVFDFFTAGLFLSAAGEMCTPLCVPLAVVADRPLDSVDGTVVALPLARPLALPRPAVGAAAPFTAPAAAFTTLFFTGAFTGRGGNVCRVRGMVGRGSTGLLEGHSEHLVTALPVLLRHAHCGNVHPTCGVVNLACGGAYRARQLDLALMHMFRLFCGIVPSAKSSQESSVELPMVMGVMYFFLSMTSLGCTAESTGLLVDAADGCAARRLPVFTHGLETGTKWGGQRPSPLRSGPKTFIALTGVGPEEVSLLISIGDSGRDSSLVVLLRSSSSSGCS